MKWAYLSNFLARGIQPVMFIVLGRLLTPDDLGLMAMALAVTGFLGLLRDAGLGPALIQHREHEDVSDQVFSAQLALGILLFILTWVISPIVALLYHDERVIPILRTLGVLFVIYPFSDVRLNLLIRDLEFKALLLRQIAPLVFSGLVSILLAYAGMGVWALVFGSVAGAVGTAVSVWLVDGWRLRLRLGRAVLKLLGFGLHVSLQNVSGWLIAWSDQVFAGVFQGAAGAGIYRIGCTVGIMPWMLIAGPFNTVIFPVLSRMRGDTPLAKEQFLSSLRWLSLVYLPSSLALVLLAPSAISLVMGEKWVGAVAIVQLIALANALAFGEAIFPEVYKAVGRPDIMTRIFLIQVPVFMAAYYLAAPRGVVTLAAAQVVLALLFDPAKLLICVRFLGIRARDLSASIQGGVAMGATVAVTGTVYHLLASRLTITGPVSLFALSVVLAFAAAITLWFSDRDAARTLAGLALLPIRSGNDSSALKAKLFRAGEHLKPETDH